MNIIFNLEQENIRISNKRISMFATDTPYYLSFINNWAGIDYV